MKKTIRVIAMVCALLLCITATTACGDKNNMKKNTTVQGGPQRDEIVATVNGTSIPAGEFQYYILQAAIMTAYQVDPTFDGDFTKLDWNQKNEDGKTFSETVINDAFDHAVADAVILENGEKNGQTISDQQRDMVEKNIQQYQKEDGEEDFMLNVNVMGFSNVEDYKNMYLKTMQIDVVKNDIQANPDSYIEDGELLKQYRVEDKATVQHILIMQNSEKHEDPLAISEQILARAKGGEDFVALMKEFNEDTGETEAGYTFGPGEMVPEFEKASFALDYDEISDIVPSEYGYHIIKRILGYAELETYWVKNASIDRFDEVLDKISVEDVVTAAYNAQTILQEKNKTQGGK